MDQTNSKRVLIFGNKETSIEDLHKVLLFALVLAFAFSDMFKSNLVAD